MRKLATLLLAATLCLVFMGAASECENKGGSPVPVRNPETMNSDNGQHTITQSFGKWRFDLWMRPSYRWQQCKWTIYVNDRGSRGYRRYSSGGSGEDALVAYQDGRAAYIDVSNCGKFRLV